MSNSYSYRYMHYVPLGHIFTACNRLRSKVMYSTSVVSDVWCRRCRQSDAYKAAMMEHTLLKPESV